MSKGGMFDSKCKLMTGVKQKAPSAERIALWRRVWIGLICDFGARP